MNSHLNVYQKLTLTFFFVVTLNSNLQTIIHSFVVLLAFIDLYLLDLYLNLILIFTLLIIQSDINFYHFLIHSLPHLQP